MRGMYRRCDGPNVLGPQCAPFTSAVQERGRPALFDLISWEHEGDVSTRCLPGRVAGHPFGADVPGHNAPVEGEGDDGAVFGFVEKSEDRAATAECVDHPIWIVAVLFLQLPAVGRAFGRPFFLCGPCATGLGFGPVIAAPCRAGTRG